MYASITINADNSRDISIFILSKILKLAFFSKDYVRLHELNKKAFKLVSETTHLSVLISVRQLNGALFEFCHYHPR